MISKENKAAVVKDNARKAGDTGSPEVQVALLTARINELMPHFKPIPSSVIEASLPSQSISSA